MNVRTRIAPSPTGSPHLGTAYIALFNLCFARAEQGRFVIRIEDTDRARSTRQAESDILTALRWLGLEWDEGPDLGGPFAPYRQSDRVAIYAPYVTRLLADGHAFRCFCSRERLADLRALQMRDKLQPGYDGHCLGLSEAEIERRLARGEQSVVRMKIPAAGVCAASDMLRGTICIDWGQVDMQVILKADGMPTYHLACVVDDHLMEISHVIRGEEWLSSLPKHLLLYEYFNWEAPEFCHMPLLRNPDRSKLSKRKNPISINYYRARGYAPEALLNCLGRMGWSMPDDREIFSLAEMIEAFRLGDVRLGEPVFDLEKLSWMSGQWLRRLDMDEFSGRIFAWLTEGGKLTRLASLVRERVEYFGQLVPQCAYLLGDRASLSAPDFEHPALAGEEIRCILLFTLWRLESIGLWQAATIERALLALAADMELRIKRFLVPVFVAISGRLVSLPLYASMELLGKDLVRQRLREALTALGGVSGKKLKGYERAYRALGVKQQ